MKRILPILAKPLVQIALICTLIALMIWLFGGYLDLLGLTWFNNIIGKSIATLVLVALVALIWVIGQISKRRRMRKAERELLRESPDDARYTETVINKKFGAALEHLRGKKLIDLSGRRQYVYEQPWYVIIGPSGSGKSAAIEALSETCLKHAFEGSTNPNFVGADPGTRDLEFMFTTEALFIDTAGQWTTQYDDVDRRRSEWRSFLERLSAVRPLEPVNGVIVAVSVDDISDQSETPIEDFALQIRNRLTELSEAISGTVPVYLLLTKCDLIRGFRECFQGTDAEERAQIWGTTFPLDDLTDPAASTRSAIQQAGPAFDTLLERLKAISLWRLSEYHNLTLEESVAVHDFPQQIEALRERINLLINRAFETTTESSGFLLRGFYLTSALQQGQPIDQFAPAFRRDQQTVHGHRVYFLEQMMSNVVLRERGLVLSMFRRPFLSRVGQWTGLIVGSAATLLICAGLWSVLDHATGTRKSISKTLDEFAASASADEFRLVTQENSDFDLVQSKIAGLQTQVALLAQTEAQPPLAGMLIDDHDNMIREAERAYYEGIKDLFVPRVLYWLETKMSSETDKVVLYKLLRSYLMLGGALEASLKAEQLSRFLLLSLENDADLAASGEQLASWEQWLGHYSEQQIQLPRQDIDSKLIEDVRTEIGRLDDSELILATIEDTPLGELDDWRLLDIGGKDADQLLELNKPAGGAVSKIVPAIYTKLGQIWLSENGMNAAIEQTVDEYWILDPKAASRKEPRRSTRNLRRQVLNLYERRYISHWRGVLDGMKIQGFNTVSGAEDVFGRLADSKSAMILILKSVADETDMSLPPSEESMEGLKNFAKREAARQAARRSAFAARNPGLGGTVLGSTSTQETSEAAGEAITREFSDLHAFVRGTDDGGPLEQIRKEARTIHSALKRASSKGDDSTDILRGSAPLNNLFDLVSGPSVPPAIERMVAAVRQDAESIGAKGAAKRIHQAWSDLHNECAGSLNGRYPFGGNPDRPVKLDTMNRILGPDGSIAQFFDRYVAEHLDERGKLRNGSRGKLAISSSGLQFFNDVKRMREIFYRPGSSEIGATVNVSVLDLPPEIEEISVTIGGRDEILNGVRTTEVSWPGSRRSEGAYVRVTYTDDTLSPDDVGISGEWGLLRTIQEYKVKNARLPPSRHRIFMRDSKFNFRLEFEFNLEDNIVSRFDEIKRFRCPKKL